MAETDPWKRQKGEGSKAYEAFLRYRDLGTGRSVRKAVGVQAVCKEGRRSYTHWWHKWSRRWHWRERAQAWDDHVHELAESERLESQLHLRQQEIEEGEKQRQLRLEEARALRTGGRRVWARFLRLVDAGEVDRMVLERVRSISVLRERGGTETRVERQAKGIVDLLELAEKAIELGQKLERQETGQPAADPPQFRMSKKEVDALADAIIRYVPGERWEEAGNEVARVLRNLGEGIRSSNG